MKINFDANEFMAGSPELHGANENLTIYYDETNNIRKLLLKENGFNVTKHDNFVLGGIVLKAEQDIGDINELRDILRIQKTAPEIKFDLVAKGNFERVLDSRKLGQALTWLLNKNIGIHYSNINILNWSILDIIESIIADDEFYYYLPAHRAIKNELYRIVIKDLPTFLGILRRYHYPNIDRSKTREFLYEVEQFIQRYWPGNVFQATTLLDELIRKAQSLPELSFLVDETPYQLIGSFEHFFLNRICTFKNSTHIFDEEYEIQKAVEKFRIVDSDREISFSFVDSKAVAGIQLSDIVVGFLGKYFTFIEQTPLKALLRIRGNLTRIQASNLELVSQLITISDRISKSLLHRVTTLDSDWKSDTFLHGRKPPQHLLMT